jgi:hypothetical protein
MVKASLALIGEEFDSLLIKYKRNKYYTLNNGVWRMEA